MIKFKQGNIFEQQTEAIVNPVNCVGVMGKGLALQFKKAFPANFREYKKMCDAGEFKVGQMLITKTDRTFPEYIINFPTKKHWRNKSQLEDIKLGLITLVQEIQRLDIKSIAIPPLGCGYGGLDWTIVKPLIIDAFNGIETVNVIVLEP